MYVCGPTVYSNVHLGNVRTFLTFDIVYRYLQHLGFKVRYVRNITDVGHLTGDTDDGEDKIGKKARLENLEPMEVVQQYTNDFHDVMNVFNILRPSIEPTATGHIVEQIEAIKQIVDNGYAYEVNGSVYFSVRTFSEDHPYGVGRKIDELLNSTRELDGQSEKRDPLDFALWKAADASHLMQWPSPWGMGFPSWHLECSVMSTKYLGETFDIHGGGMDLKFPHHECEIAQNVACSSESQPVKYWMHGNMLGQWPENGEVRRQRLHPEELITGNHKLLEQGYSPMTVRFFMLMGHYASTLDFSNEALQAAEKGLAKLEKAVETLATLEPSERHHVRCAGFRRQVQRGHERRLQHPDSHRHVVRWRESRERRGCRPCCALCRGHRVASGHLPGLPPGRAGVGLRSKPKPGGRRRRRRGRVVGFVGGHAHRRQNEQGLGNGRQNPRRPCAQGITIQDGKDGSSWSRG